MGSLRREKRKVVLFEYYITNFLSGYRDGKTHVIVFRDHTTTPVDVNILVATDN